MIINWIIFELLFYFYFFILKFLVLVHGSFQPDTIQDIFSKAQVSFSSIFLFLFFFVLIVIILLFLLFFKISQLLKKLKCILTDFFLAKKNTFNFYLLCFLNFDCNQIAKNCVSVILLKLFLSLQYFWLCFFFTCFVFSSFFVFLILVVKFFLY